MARTDSLLDEAMPSYDHREVHELFVAAPAHVVWSAAKSVPAKEVRSLSPLMAVRTLPHVLSGKSRGDLEGALPLLEIFHRLGVVVLEERSGEEIVLGGAGKFWSLAGSKLLHLNREQFLAFQRAGFAKFVTNLRVTDEGDGSRISTETRVVSTSPAAKTAFARYWFIIRLGSGLIRRSWLAAISRRALAALAADSTSRVW